MAELFFLFCHREEKLLEADFLGFYETFVEKKLSDEGLIELLRECD